MEQVVALVKAYEVGKPDALVVVIPKVIRRELGIAKGSRFIIKIDAKGRLIYEPLVRPNLGEHQEAKKHEVE